MGNADNSGRRFPLNFFDIIIIVIVVIIAFVLIYMSTSGRISGTDGISGQVVYTFELADVSEDTKGMINEGDLIVDKIRKYQIGRVKSVSYEPYKLAAIDYENQTRIFPEVQGRYNANVTVVADCVETEENLTVSGGYNVKVGMEVSILGPGYSGGGYVTSIERE